MPILKFVCHGCGKEFAKIFTDPANAPKYCPVCGADQLEELGPAFHPDVMQMRRSACVACDSCDQAIPCTIAVSR